ncbi:Flp pilus assembly protein CpaB [Sphingomonas corticis]|jgi:pilus assembly protein CpaB|uniref:Flp pilus assembly protein CpaB n=1 Tax=Sphingomonas corticis TaxID=2722791 RepID=A0ABX1CSD6_9SPHN|nr:Flp pilus assembly protein CpaB [Sphingomonas corticis]NJR80221.1 Flp pilus assembly protein CpaB [Sphingomonas corticis]
MDTRKVILLVGALFVAAVTAFVARSLVAGAAAPEAAAVVAPAPVVDGPEVLVATRALPVGTILDAAALKFQPWPKEMVENAYFKKEGTDLSKLIGTVVRNAITAGQPVTQGALVKPGDRGFLAAALGAGMRAVTVPVSAQTSVAGFVFPGDHIDLILTQSVTGGGDGPPLKTSETVVRNLRVLATDQRTSDEKDSNGNTVVSTFSTVTVEATPKIAEQIAVAQTIGNLSLSLRSIADNAGELEQAIASGAVSVGDGKDPKAEKAMLARLASTPQAGNATYVVGADVSRFQRRTVPAEVQGASAPVAAAGPAMGTPAVKKGPTVRVVRGNTVTDISQEGKN